MTDINQLGTEQTRTYAIAAGGQLEIDADLDQILILELVGPTSIGLAINHGPLSSAGGYKGKEVSGTLRHLRFVNDSALGATLTLAMIKGLIVRDRRLNLVGDALGVTEALFGDFTPLPAVEIPGLAVRQLAATNAARRQLYVTNKPSNMREVYVSASEIETPDADPDNGDFEAGDLTGWTQVSGSWSALEAAAFAGSFGARVAGSFTGASRTLRQDIGLEARGFTTELIDAGGLRVTFEGQGRRNSGANATKVQAKVQFLDGSLVLISELDTGALEPTVGDWISLALEGAIPADTRTLRVDLIGVPNSFGCDFDAITMIVDGVPPSEDELAAHVPPNERLVLPTTAAIFAYNPHPAPQTVLLGEVT